MNKEAVICNRGCFGLSSCPRGCIAFGPQCTLFTPMHKKHRDERAPDECHEACRKQSKAWRARHKLPEVGTRYQRYPQVCWSAACS